MKSEIEADIEFLKQMAEQGQKSPLQGGEHGVLWGGMFTLSALYAVAYSTTAQVSGDPKQYVFSGTAIAASVASVFTMGTYEMFLVMAAGLFCSAVIPGYLTRSKPSVAA